MRGDLITAPCDNTVILDESLGWPFTVRRSCPEYLRKITCARLRCKKPSSHRDPDELDDEHFLILVEIRR